MESSFRSRLGEQCFNDALFLYEWETGEVSALPTIFHAVRRKGHPVSVTPGVEVVSWNQGIFESIGGAQAKIQE